MFFHFQFAKYGFDVIFKLWYAKLCSLYRSGMYIPASTAILRTYELLSQNSGPCVSYSSSVPTCVNSCNNTNLFILRILHGLKYITDLSYVCAADPNISLSIIIKPLYFVKIRTRNSFHHSSVSSYNQPATASKKLSTNS